MVKRAKVDDDYERGGERECKSENTSTAAAAGKNDEKKEKLDRRRREKEVRARLNDEARKEICPLALGTVAMMGSALANQAVPRLLGRLLDEKSCATVERMCPAHNSMFGASEALAAVVIGGGFASFLRTTLLNRAQDDIAQRLRTKLFGAVLSGRDMEWFVSGGRGADDCGAGGGNAAKTG